MIDFAAISHKGYSRENNEDCYAVIKSPKDDFTVFIIADGMGGHSSGELASKTAVTYISSEIRNSAVIKADMVPGILDKWIEGANAKIYNLSLETTSNIGMGTTLTLSLICGNKLYIAHIGDSRIYLVRDGAIKLLTSDHSYVEELVKSGSISRSEAVGHPGRNVITRAVGNTPEVEADIYEYDIMESDILLICTDGLTGLVKEDEMLEAALNGGSPESVCMILDEIAGSRGGNDDTTVITVKMNHRQSD